MTLADTLGCLPSTKNKDIIDLKVRIDLVRFSNKHLNDMGNEARKDPILN